MSDLDYTRDLLIEAIRGDDYASTADIVNRLPMKDAMELIVKLATEVSILRRGR